MTQPSEVRKTAAPVPHKLRNLLLVAQRNHVASLDSLRGAVCDYVDQLRGTDVPYDDIVRTVQKLVRGIGGKTPQTAEAAKQNTRLVETMVQWCKERCELPC